MDFKAIVSRLYGLNNETDSCLEEIGDEMAGDTGFLSFRRRLRIRKGDSTISVFLKFSDTTRHDSGALKDMMDSFCPRECLFYGCFAPLLERTAAQLGIGSIGLPNVYQELVLPTGTLIVMEDLSEAGFELAPPVLNAEEARCVVASLARVQAAFWLTKDRLGSSASSLFGPKLPLRDAFNSSARAAAAGFNALLPGCFTAFRQNFAQYLKCEKQVGVINAYLEDSFLEKSMKVMVSSQEELELIGVTHSDLWYNNCMIRRDALGQPREARLIDWQFFGVGWLTYDLGPLWISSIENGLVTKDFLACVDFYYQSMRAAYEAALPMQKFPVSLEQSRQQAVQSLVYGIAWVVLQADFLGTFRRIDNILANVADVIVFFKL